MASAQGIDLLQLFAAALGGGLTVKIVDIAYQEVRRRLDTKSSATRFVDEHLDPLLKATDELVAKLTSLANEDFRPLSDLPTADATKNSDLGGLIYLFGRCWARIEILRQEGLSVAIARDPRGRKLQSFFACLESGRIRIVDRISQKAVGELLTMPTPNHLRTLGYVEFVRAYERDEEFRRWFSPLVLILTGLQHTSNRQRLLEYGVVLHALVDTLDDDHVVTGKRPSYPAKLSEKTRKDLRYRVFKVYLPFIADREKYLEGSRKRGGDPS